LDQLRAVLSCKVETKRRELRLLVELIFRLHFWNNSTAHLLLQHTPKASFLTSFSLIKDVIEFRTFASISNLNYLIWVIEICDKVWFFSVNVVCSYGHSLTDKKLQNYIHKRILLFTLFYTKCSTQQSTVFPGIRRCYLCLILDRSWCCKNPVSELKNTRNWSRFIKNWYHQDIFLPKRLFYQAKFQRNNELLSVLCLPC